MLLALVVWAHARAGRASNTCHALRSAFFRLSSPLVVTGCAVAGCARCVSSSLQEKEPGRGGGGGGGSGREKVGIHARVFGIICHRRVPEARLARGLSGRVASRATAPGKMRAAHGRRWGSHHRASSQGSNSGRSRAGRGWCRRMPAVAAAPPVRGVAAWRGGRRRSYLFPEDEKRWHQHEATVAKRRTEDGVQDDPGSAAKVAGPHRRIGNEDGRPANRPVADVAEWKRRGSRGIVRHVSGAPA